MHASGRIKLNDSVAKKHRPHPSPKVVLYPLVIYWDPPANEEPLNKESKKKGERLLLHSPSQKKPVNLDVPKPYLGSPVNQTRLVCASPSSSSFIERIESIGVRLPRPETPSSLLGSHSPGGSTHSMFRGT
ncbi:uncharacterized protein LOC113301262 isoform X2 [Papaver somniferum]|uniref:uncharacterized protein LOC113301262 isoform X2 n=1 Tax=Papaver somniferum TaxID=3469 RepID=UPI000E7012E5|nr:uncharacterized protein LOC113301262 isoform X2 [Papaver somniferum]